MQIPWALPAFDVNYSRAQLARPTPLRRAAPVGREGARNSCGICDQWEAFLKDPSPVFFLTFDAEPLAKIHRHQWKEHVEISKFAKFESYMWETGKDMNPQSRENLQTFISWGAHINLQIHLLQIHILQIYLLQIHPLQIHVLQIQSMIYKSRHVLQIQTNPVYSNFYNMPPLTTVFIMTTLKLKNWNDLLQEQDL